MKVLIINGSHRRGNTYKFAEYLEQTLIARGDEVEVVNLVENRFMICDGCLSCEETGVCVQSDFFSEKLVPKLMSSDAYVFATPIYFNTVPALLKNFIDRTNCLCAYYEEHPKKVAFFLVGQLEEAEGSLSSCLAYLKEYAEIMNFEIEENNILTTAREPGEFVVDNHLIAIVEKWFREE